MSGSIVLKVKGATKRFGGLVAVNDLSFEVGEHEVLGLIGPNGSGKTTMINLISGVFRLTSGKVELGNEVLSGLAAHRISQKGVARTFQLVKILPSLTITENVIAGCVFGFHRIWGKESEMMAHRLLERVGLKVDTLTQTEQLTYIDQKRLELARALAGKPKLLLLDEWLAGLNPTELQLGIDLIKDLRADGLTIVIVEHVMDAIRSLCDRCIVMNSGVKIADGDVTSTLTDPEVVRAYLGDSDA